MEVATNTPAPPKNRSPNPPEPTLIPLNPPQPLHSSVSNGFNQAKITSGALSEYPASVPTWPLCLSQRSLWTDLLRDH